MKAHERFTFEVIETMREEIQKAMGNEVLFVGLCGEAGKIVEISPAARGAAAAVPALFPFMEKGHVVVHNHPSGELTPSYPDISIAARLGNDGIGFYIVDNEVEHVYAAVEPVLCKNKTGLNEKILLSILDKGGGLEKRLPGFEPRQAQLVMLEGVLRSFNEDKICLMEAGTGVGKSFAYLVPALTWAEQNDERVVVSTSTINLQQQLLDKDIPIIKEVLKTKVKTTLVKGRGNYLCLRRMNVFREEASLFVEDNEQFESIAAWSAVSATGSRHDLSFLPNDMLWSQICSEADACIGIRCPYRESCFVIKARREAASSQVLITNHHLLFSDVALRSLSENGDGGDILSVLPPFSRIIFDEAHNIEASATSFFSEKLNRATLYKQLSALYRKKKRKTIGLSALLEKKGASKLKIKEIPKINDGIMDAMLTLEETAAVHLSANASLRLKDLDRSVQDEITSGMANLRGLLVKLIQLCTDIADSLEENPDIPELYELAILRRRLSSITGILNQFVDRDDFPNRIFWMEQVRLSNGEKIVVFYNTPLDMSDLMLKSIFEAYPTVVCTSASLTVRNAFTHFKSRLGLEKMTEDRLIEEVIPSPFPFKKNVLLAVPTDGPDPNSPEYTPRNAELILKILEISEGRALILFTSFDMLNKTYNLLSGPLERAGIPALKQGSLDKAKLLGDFTRQISSVLFATDSFWEGIDAPGETLSVVVICRLPFKVPTDPVVKSRVEAMELKGRNSFLEYSVPEAALKLKQGFGRLIRRTEDRGTVIILDSRIVKKSYGSLLIGSLPETLKSFKPEQDMLRDIERFLYDPSRV